MIILYGAETCPQCRMVKQVLMELKFPFEYVDVYKLKNEDVDKLGLKTIPSIKLGIGKPISLHGFSRSKIKEVLKG